MSTIVVSYVNTVEKSIEIPWNFMFVSTLLSIDILWEVRKKLANQMSINEKREMDLKLGFVALIILSTVVPLLIILIDPLSPINMVILGTISGTCIVFNLLLVSPILLQFELYEKEYNQFRIITIFFFFLLFSILCAFLTFDEKNEGGVAWKALFQIVCGLQASLCISELWNLKNNEFIIVPIAHMILEADQESNSMETKTRFDELECKICVRKYDENNKYKTPRVLKECGHTVCLGCAETLMKKKDLIFIACPFCRVETYLSRFSAESLPRNYAIIGMLRELEQDELVLANPE